MSLETPVLFCVYNRPELTARVFETIARQRPKQLLLSCDGPRPDSDVDRERVEQTRRVVSRVDWPCDVTTLYSECNVGCRKQMAMAIDWAFAQHDRVIVLEDDCYPDPSFFSFCQPLLERYCEDPRVMMISGDNFQTEPRSCRSYYFSKYAHIWGWASWRRAWSHFDLQMRSWPGNRSSGLWRNWVPDRGEHRYWRDIFDQQYAGKIDTWDYSWMYACWQNQGWTILPEVNLVSNIGFGEDATHTRDAASQLANRATGTVTQLVHPTVISCDTEADRLTWETVFDPARLHHGTKRHRAKSETTIKRAA